MFGTLAYDVCGMESYLAAFPRPVPVPPSSGGGVFSRYILVSGAAGAAGL